MTDAERIDRLSPREREVLVLPDRAAPAITFFAEGEPKGQPRVRAFARRMGSRVVARVYDPGTAEAWKSQIAVAARDHLPTRPLSGPLELSVRFIMPRPKKHYRGGKRAHELRPDAPHFHEGAPDLDNLLKAVKDALTTIGVWRDDRSVARYGPDTEKVYGERAGAHVVIRTLAPSPLMEVA